MPSPMDPTHGHASSRTNELCRGCCMLCICAIAPQPRMPEWLQREPQAGDKAVPKRGVQSVALNIGTFTDIDSAKSVVEGSSASRPVPKTLRKTSSQTPRNSGLGQLVFLCSGNTCLRNMPNHAISCHGVLG